jgi:hypothetical protein
MNSKPLHPNSDPEFDDLIKQSISRVAREQLGLKEKAALARFAKSHIALITLHKTKYFYLDIYKSQLLNITKSDFKRRHGKFIQYNNLNIKYTFGDKPLILNRITQILDPLTEMQIKNDRLIRTYTLDYDSDDIILHGPSYKPEGLPEFYETIINTLTGIVCALRVSNAVGTVVNSFPDYGSFVLEILDIIFSTINLIKTAKSNIELDLTTILLIFIKISKLFLFFERMTEYESEGFEAFVIAGASLFLPSKLLEIFKRMSLFSSVKLLDDPASFLNFFELIFDFMNTFISYIPKTILDFIPTHLLTIFDFRPYALFMRLRALYNAWQGNLRLMLDDTFRTNVKNLKIKLDQTLKTYDLAKYSKQLQIYISDFIRMFKSVKSYEETSRVEPSCFIFEGPPGVFKSTHANMLVTILKHTHYSHLTKSSTDGKDFYDTYCNETIFRMDDVGQQSLSQWRNIINFVSPTKLPLDCAAVSLKDTIYFNSEIIILTTNQFTNLTGFTSQDGVADKRALFRRGYVFDYKNVTREGNKLKGLVRFKYYDQKSDIFLNAFPQEFLDYLDDKGVIPMPPTCDVSNTSDLFVWMSTIVEGFRLLKNEQHDDNKLTEPFITQIRRSNPFFPEGKLTDLNAILIQEHNAEHIELTTVDGIPHSDLYEHDPPGYLNLFREILEIVFTSIFSCVCDFIKDVSSDLTKFMRPMAVIIISSVIIHVVKNLIISTINKTAELVTNKIVTMYKAESIIPYALETYIDTVKDREYHRNRHPLISKVVDQMYLCKIYGKTKTELCYCLISQKYVILPHHVCRDDQAQLTIYKDYDKNNIIIDNMIVNKTYFSDKGDVAIWALSKGYASPRQCLASCFKKVNKEAKVLTFEKNVIPIERIRVEGTSNVTYPISERKYNTLDNPLHYNIHFPGMCGALVLSQDGDILGFHVAGHSTLNDGVAVFWSNEIKEQITNELRKPNGLYLNSKISDKLFDDFSGEKLVGEVSVNTPKQSNFIPTALYGIFDISRIPANLTPYGPHTIKDIGKKSMKPIQSLEFSELEFGTQVLDIIIDDFDDLTDSEVIQGNDTLAKMNPKSSNGHFPLKTKHECFDYENGQMTPSFEELYYPFLERLSSNEIKQSDLVWIETPKDELRSISKTEPRTFRLCSVAVQFITKKIFGNMVTQIVTNRKFNKIMIGINPFKDWNDFYRELEPSGTFDGDAQAFDKNMLPQVQDYVAQCILKKYKGKYKDIAHKLLTNLIYNIVCLNDDVFILTHSLPSGCFLTALINSFVNRFYAAMWYNRYHPNPIPTKFYLEIYDYNYGDDKVVSVKNPTIRKYLNAITMSEFFNSIGIPFTNAKKTKITEQFCDLSEVSFLKRKFVYHRQLETIVGPLELSTLYSGLSFVDGTKDVNLVLQDKMHNFQREIFLHQDRYLLDVDKLENACKKS